MLPMERPAINFTDPPTQEPPRPSPSEESKLKQRSAVRATLTGSKPPRDGLRVMSGPASCIRRRYHMAYTPSGFWSRLISRLIINLKRSGLMEEQAASQSGPPIIYWRRGIVVIHAGGRFIVESIQSTKKCWPLLSLSLSLSLSLHLPHKLHVYIVTHSLSPSLPLSLPPPSVQLQ